MKGLFLKDLYMIKAYCRMYLLIIVVFLAASFFGESLFLIYYPCMMCGMIPVTLLAYDERSRFQQYSASLPVSRAEVVSEKYLIGLFAQVAVLLVTGLVQGFRMRADGSFSAERYAVMMLSLLLVSMLASSVPLPLIFKSGVEKGRIAYYVTIGIVCGSAVLFSEVFKGEATVKLPSVSLFVLLAVIAAGIYALSWILSVKFYQKREL